jgi:hypothetical protein
MPKNHCFSHSLSIFHNRPLPEKESLLAGYSALMASYNLSVPTPDLLSAISHKHKKYQHDHWMMYTPRHAPKDTLVGHLTFALKYEGIHLALLKALFSLVDTKEISNYSPLRSGNESFSLCA